MTKKILQVVILQATEDELNKWILAEENQDKEIISIVPYGGTVSAPYVLISYYKKVE